MFDGRRGIDKYLKHANSRTRFRDFSCFSPHIFSRIDSVNVPTTVDWIFTERLMRKIVFGGCGNVYFFFLLTSVSECRDDTHDKCSLFSKKR